MKKFKVNIWAYNQENLPEKKLAPSKQEEENDDLPF